MGKKVLFSLLAILVVTICLVSCVSTDTGKEAKLYIVECALPRDGSGMMPGTFTLPNGTRVPLGSVIQEGDWLYTVGSAKVVDATYNVNYQASAEQARMVCREALANYLNAKINTASGRSSSTSNGMNTTSSETKSASFSSASLTGMEDAGYVLSSDDTSYILARINLTNIDEIDSTSEKFGKTAGKVGEKVLDSVLDRLFK